MDTTLTEPCAMAPRQPAEPHIWTGPSAREWRNWSLTPLRPGPPAVCDSPALNHGFILYDQHTAKNGGSTMGLLMRRLEQYQRCTYWGNDLTESRWNEVLAVLHKVRADEPPPRLCVEAHMAWGCKEDCWARRLRQLDGLKKQYQQRGVPCRIVRVLRVQAPLPHYASFYSQFVDTPKMRTTHREDWALKWTFGAWARRTPNLQSRDLMASDHPCSRIRCPTHKQDHKRRLSVTLEDVDLLLPTAHFSTMVVLLSDALRIDVRLMAYHHVSPKCLGHPWTVVPVDLDDPLRTNRRRASLELRVAMCQAHSEERRATGLSDTTMAAAVGQAAPLDLWLHALAHNASRAARRLDPTLSGRVATFDARTVGVWRGGPPVMPVCKMTFNRTFAASLARGGCELSPCHLNPPALRALLARMSPYACVPAEALERRHETDIGARG